MALGGTTSGRPGRPSQPEPERGQLDHREKMGRALLLAGCDSPVLLQATDEALDAVPLAIRRTDGWSITLVTRLLI